MAVAFVLQVVENLWILLRSGHAQVIEGLEGDDPWGDGGTKVLAEEWAEGDIFPLLDVTCGPVVEQDQAKDVVLRLGRRDPFAERVRSQGGGTGRRREAGCRWVGSGP